MPEKSVRLIAVGDIFLGEHPVTLGHGVTTITRKNGCDFLFQAVREYLQDGDIVCGNLEGIISPKLENETGINSEIFWGEPGCAESLKKAGFNCLFLANNHTAQHGKNALERTCALLTSHNIQWTGYNSTDPRTAVPTIFKINDLKVGLLAYCDTQQYNLDTPLLPIINYENIKSEIEKLKKQCDLVIISLHWGDEFIDYPSPNQVELAHTIINAGANMIVGHHSHRMQGIENYNNGIIVYSLGSFIKDLWPRKLRESVILKCELSHSGIKNVQLVPILIHPKKHYPEIYSDEAGQKFIFKIQQLSENLTDQTPTNTVQLLDKYFNDVNKLLFRDRVGTVFHYVFNLFRYDKKILLENIKLMVKRRLNKKNI